MASREAPVTIGILFSQTGVTSVIERAQRQAALLAIHQMPRNAYPRGVGTTRTGPAMRMTLRNTICRLKWKRPTLRET